MHVGLDSFVRLAVPLFVLWGYLIESCGLLKRLVNFIECFLGMIVYGAQMKLNVPKMFAGTVIPGLMMAAPIIIINQKVLSLPVIILVGIYTGIFTPAETAAIACVYSLFLGLIYRGQDLKKIIASVKISII